MPETPPDAVVDPHWLELTRGRTALPAFYLPSSMPRQLGRWGKATAWTVIVLLVSAAGGGICLTYGPDEMLRIIGL